MCFLNLHFLWRVAKRHEIKSLLQWGKVSSECETDEVLLRLNLTHWVNSYTISDTSSTTSWSPFPHWGRLISNIFSDTIDYFKIICYNLALENILVK